jgi:hypothetical protein
MPILALKNAQSIVKYLPTNEYGARVEVMASVLSFR